MKDTGWIKLHRSITDSFVFDNPDRLKFWVWCLCKASHKDRKQTVGLQEIELKKGQFIFGRKKASAELNMDENKIYRLSKTFQKREKIVVKSNNKYSLVTVVNWEFYQGERQQSEQLTDNKPTTNRQQTDTNKNVKNIKNEKIILWGLVEDCSKDLVRAYKDFNIMRNSIKKPLTKRALAGIIKKVDNFADNESDKIKILENSIEHSWQTVYELKMSTSKESLSVVVAPKGWCE